MSNLTEIQYPCYIHKKVEGAKIIYIHDTMFHKEVGDTIDPETVPKEVQEIFKLRNYVLEGIYEDDKLYIYDGMTLDEYNTKTCNLIYEDRLGLVRHCVNCIGKYKHIIDMPLDVCNNVGEVLIIKEKLKERGYSSIVRNMHDKYKFKGD